MIRIDRGDRRKGEKITKERDTNDERLDEIIDQNGIGEDSGSNESETLSNPIRPHGGGTLGAAAVWEREAEQDIVWGAS